MMRDGEERKPKVHDDERGRKDEKDARLGDDATTAAPPPWVAAYPVDLFSTWIADCSLHSARVLD